MPLISLSYDMKLIEIQNKSFPWQKNLEDDWQDTNNFKGLLWIFFKNIKV